MSRLKGVSFETTIIKRYRRRESSVKKALIEMHLAGVSVRRVDDTIEVLWGNKVSLATISELNKKPTSVSLVLTCLSSRFGILLNFFNYIRSLYFTCLNRFWELIPVNKYLFFSSKSIYNGFFKIIFRITQINHYIW